MASVSTEPMGKEVTIVLRPGVATGDEETLQSLASSESIARERKKD
jgi:hypothetical protein